MRGTTILCILLLHPWPLRSAEIVVAGKCTLAAAIHAANDGDDGDGRCPPGGSPGEDTVRLTHGIVLTAPDNDGPIGPNGVPVITTDVVVDGDGFAIRRASDAPPFRLFDVRDATLTLRNVFVLDGSAGFGAAVSAYNASVVLEGATLAGNIASGAGGAVSAYSYPADDVVTITGSVLSGNRAAWGGSISVAGVTLRVEDSEILDNEAVSGSGGGILVSSTLESPTTVVISRSVIAGNVALAGSGGGLSAYASRTDVTIDHAIVSSNRARFGGGVHSRSVLRIADTLIAGNQAEQFGGAVYAEGRETTLQRTTLAGNSASGGGGMSVSAQRMPNVTARVVNSTVSGNTASSYGAGLDNYRADLTVEHTTITGNDAPDGAGVHTEASATTRLVNGIVADNPGGAECAGPLIVAGTGFATDDSCPGMVSVASATVVAPVLADNGGPTPTHGLLPGSPAVDAAGACGLPTDQRGFARVVGPCDSGAFELGAETCADRCAADEFQTGALPELRRDGSCRRGECAPRDGATPGEYLCALPVPAPGDGWYVLAPDGDPPWVPLQPCDPPPAVMQRGPNVNKILRFGTRVDAGS